MTIVTVIDGFLACMFFIVNFKKRGGSTQRADMELLETREEKKYELDNAVLVRELHKEQNKHKS